MCWLANFDQTHGKSTSNGECQTEVDQGMLHKHVALALSQLDLTFTASVHRAVSMSLQYAGQCCASIWLCKSDVSAYWLSAWV